MLIMAFIMIPILKFEEDKIGPKKSPLRRRQSRRGGIVIVIIIMMMVIINIIKTIIITLRKQRKRVLAIIRLAIFDSWKLGSPMGLNTFLQLKWPFPWEWPLLTHGKWAVPWDWPLFQGTGPYFQAKSGQSRGQSHV